MNRLLNWVEIPASDMSRAKKFYEAVLHVEFQEMDLGDTKYAMFPSEDAYNCGTLVQGSHYTPSADGVTIYTRLWRIDNMTTITDDFMKEMMATTKAYCVVILKAGPNMGMDGTEKIVWEHGRRNFSLRADGVLSIVCPVSDGSDVKGVGIFNASMDEVKKIMDEDPGVKVGLFVYEIHPCRSFPGDCLPK